MRYTVAKIQGIHGNAPPRQLAKQATKELSYFLIARSRISPAEKTVNRKGGPEWAKSSAIHPNSSSTLCLNQWRTPAVWPQAVLKGSTLWTKVRGGRDLSGGYCSETRAGTWNRILSPIPAMVYLVLARPGTSRSRSSLQVLAGPVIVPVGLASRDGLDSLPDIRKYRARFRILTKVHIFTTSGRCRRGQPSRRS